MKSEVAELSARHRGHDARLLSDSLRTSRVTLLYGEDGVSRTGLLTEGVLPLLRRRAGDGPSRGARKARAAGPSVERRTAGEDRRRRSERVILFNDWVGAPLAALEVSILSSLPMGAVMQSEHHRLADLLADVCDRLDAQFLIVFDAFERLWDPDSRADATLDFIEQLVEAANRNDLTANFLLSIDASAKVRLEALRHRISGFDDSTLWLHAELPRRPKEEVVEPSMAHEPSLRSNPLPVLPLADAVPAPIRPERTRRKRRPRQPLPPPAPIRTETVYAFIESTLTQTADASEPWHGTVDASTVPRQAVRAAVDRSDRPLSRGRLALAGDLTSRSAPTPPRLPFDDPAPPLVEPVNPIDQWLDVAIAWCRRVLHLR